MPTNRLLRVLYSPVTPCVFLPVNSYLGARLLADGHTASGSFTTGCAVLLLLHLLARGWTRVSRDTAPARVS